MQKETINEKNQKKELGKKRDFLRQENREVIIPCFCKRVTKIQRKTQEKKKKRKEKKREEKRREEKRREKKRKEKKRTTGVVDLYVPHCQLYLIEATLAVSRTVRSGQLPIFRASVRSIGAT